jgi:hypothetical protein
MQIDETVEQLANAHSPIREGEEPDPNLRSQRDEHPEKQFHETTGKEEGMQIDESDEQSEKRRFPRREIEQPRSNSTLASFRHSWKQLSPRV